MTRTTPPRPVDITTVFPQLAPLARTTTRLHPRPGPVSMYDSSMGGPLLWPADEPWPRCDATHQEGIYPLVTPADLRLLRQHGLSQVSLTTLDVQRRLDAHRPADRRRTAAEWELLERLALGHPMPTEPVAMLPVAQLYARDVSCLRPPTGTDLLQVLWCPFNHGPLGLPRAAMYWRAAGEVTEVLTEPPEPEAIQHGQLVPETCQLHPENVTEYPDQLTLDEDLQERIGEWSERQRYKDTAEAFYDAQLSVAPGCKVGGWAPWGRTDPFDVSCEACGTTLEPLLTIASWEWDCFGYDWIPIEDQQALGDAVYQARNTEHLGIMIGDADKLQLYVCPADPRHPHSLNYQ